MPAVIESQSRISNWWRGFCLTLESCRKKVLSQRYSTSLLHVPKIKLNLRSCRCREDCSKISKEHMARLRRWWIEPQGRCKVLIYKGRLPLINSFGWSARDGRWNSSPTGEHFDADAPTSIWHILLRSISENTPTGIILLRYSRAYPQAIPHMMIGHMSDSMKYGHVKAETDTHPESLNTS